MTTYPLRRVRLRAGEEHRETLEVAVEPLSLGGATYGCVPRVNEVALTIQRATGGDVFSIAFESGVEGPCMRCLAEARAEVTIDAREYQDASPDAALELRSDYVSDGELLLSDWARDQIALTLPTQILCRPGCAGLCDVCGKDLNMEPHSHAGTTVDPRWAALEALRDDTRTDDT